MVRFPEGFSPFFNSLSPVTKEILGRGRESKRFLIGKEDICANEERVFEPWETAFLEVIFTRDDFPLIDTSIEDTTTLKELSYYVDISVRSRGAQAGLSAIGFAAVPEIKTQGENIKTKIILVNFGGRPIGIREGDRVARLYSQYGAQLLKGQELYQAIKQGEINIVGELGKDWDFFSAGLLPIDFHRRHELCEKNFQKYGFPYSINLLTEAIKGIGLRLEPERFYIPPGEETIYIFDEVLDDYPGGYRQFLQDEVFKPVPEEAEPVFWVGKTTATLQLEEGYNGILRRDVKLAQSYIDKAVGMQTLSNLITGGQTDWQIMIELFTPEAQKPENIFIFLYVYKDQPEKVTL